MRFPGSSSPQPTLQSQAFKAPYLQSNGLHSWTIRSPPVTRTIHSYLLESDTGSLWGPFLSSKIFKNSSIVRITHWLVSRGI